MYLLLHPILSALFGWFFWLVSTYTYWINTSNQGRFIVSRIFSLHLTFLPGKELEDERAFFEKVNFEERWKIRH